MQEWQLQKWNKHPEKNDLSRFHGKSGMGIVLQRTCPKEKTEGGLPWWLSGKASACNAGDPGLIPGSGRSAGEGIGYPLQYSWAFLVAQLVRNQPTLKEIWIQSLGWEGPLEKGEATHCSILEWRTGEVCGEKTTYLRNSQFSRS